MNPTNQMNPTNPTNSNSNLNLNQNLNINIVTKNFKKSNNYNGRGNTNALEHITDAYTLFLDYFNHTVSSPNSLRTIFGKTAAEPLRNDVTRKELRLLKDLIDPIRINHILIDNFSFKDINSDVPSINISYVQNEKHRSRFDEMMATTDEIPIVFDRTKDNKNYSNGLFFAKDQGKQFMPRFFGIKYRGPEAFNNTIGIYIRPETCPLQVEKIQNMLLDLDKDIQDRPTRPVPAAQLPQLKVVFYGSKLEINLKRIKTSWCTDKKEFFSTIGLYLYSPMEFHDPMPNTLIEAAYNNIPVCIWAPKGSETLEGFRVIEELQMYWRETRSELPIIKSISSLKEYLRIQQSNTAWRIQELQVQSALMHRFIIFSTYISITRFLCCINAKYTWFNPKQMSIMFNILNHFHSYQLTEEFYALDDPKERINLIDILNKTHPAFDRILDKWLDAGFSPLGTPPVETPTIKDTNGTTN